MPDQLDLKASLQELTPPPLADLWQIDGPYTVRQLHNGSELLHSRMAKLDGWLGDGTLVEEGDGAVYGFFSVYSPNCVLGALAWL